MLLQLPKTHSAPWRPIKIIILFLAFLTFQLFSLWRQSFGIKKKTLFTCRHVVHQFTHEHITPAMWLYWQESNTGISIMLPDGGRAHVSKYCASALTFSLALSYQQNSFTEHPFLVSVRELMECDRSEEFTPRSERFELSPFWLAWHDLHIWDPVQARSRTVTQVTASEFGCLPAAQLPHGHRRYLSRFISCSPMQVTQSELWTRRKILQLSIWKTTQPASSLKPVYMSWTTIYPQPVLTRPERSATQNLLIV